MILKIWFIIFKPWVYTCESFIKHLEEAFNILSSNSKYIEFKSLDLLNKFDRMTSLIIGVPL